MDLSAIIQWQSLVEEAVAPYNGKIEANDVLAIIWLESRGKSDTVNPHFPAVGLMGVVAREAGDDFKERPTVEELKDPKTNIEWGIKILAYFLNRSKGSFWKALYRYSGGSVWANCSDFNQRYWEPFGAVRAELEERDE